MAQDPFPFQIPIPEKLADAISADMRRVKDLSAAFLREGNVFNPGDAAQCKVLADDILQGIAGICAALQDICVQATQEALTEKFPRQG